MTSTDPASRRARIRRRVADAVAAHSALWASFERIAPDPDPYLHWEPTASGWRLFGHLTPPGRPGV